MLEFDAIDDSVEIGYKYTMKELEKYDLSSLKYISYGTEPMPNYTLSRLLVCYYREGKSGCNLNSRSRSLDQTRVM